MKTKTTLFVVALMMIVMPIAVIGAHMDYNPAPEPLEGGCGGTVEPIIEENRQEPTHRTRRYDICNIDTSIKGYCELDLGWKWQWFLKDGKLYQLRTRWVNAYANSRNQYRMLELIGNGEKTVYHIEKEGYLRDGISYRVDDKSQDIFVGIANVR